MVNSAIIRPYRWRRIVLLLILIGLLSLTFLSSLAAGSSGMSIGRAVSLLFNRDGSVDEALIFNVRMPRASLAALVGVNLAMAGVLIQTLTRNPLASPQTFGINAGASVGIVVLAMVFPLVGALGNVIPAFIGASIVGCVMWALSLDGKANNMKIALSGITIQLVLSALIQGVLIADNSTQDMIFWLVGSVSTAQWPKVLIILPFTIIGGTVAILAARYIGVLALDRITSQSLGQDPKSVAALTCALILILACPAVAVAGPIGFVGLIVPHIVRFFAGEDQRALLILSGLGGALLLCGADLAGRLFAYPAELPVGILTAMLGAPAFLVIAARKRVR